MTPLVALSLLSFVRMTDAWGTDGHTIVAHIAQQLVTADVNTTLQALLDGWNLNNASDWCDSYDHSPEGRWSSALHFINYVGHACSFSWEDDCKDDWCNAGAIVNYTKQVADSTLSLERRQFALRFLVHMMGDIHQPLHVSSGDDEGGNLIKIGGNKFSSDASHWLNHSATLHAQWDTSLVEQTIFDMYDNKLQAPKGPWKPVYHKWWLISNMVVQKLSGEWSSKKSEWEQIVAHPSDETSLRGGLAVVAGESAQRGCTYAYADETGSRVATGDILSHAYYERAKPIVVEQLAKGGVRLAQILNAALKPAAVIVV